MFTRPHLYRLAGLGIMGAVLLVASGKLAAQSAESGSAGASPSPWYVSVGAGNIMYEGDEATKGGWDMLLRLGYDYSPRWTFRGEITYFPELKANYVYDYGHAEARPGLDGESTWAAGVAGDALCHLLVQGGQRWDPYLIGGIGLLHYEKSRAWRAQTDIPVRAGVGLAYNFTPEWALNLDVMGHMTLDKQEFNFIPSGGISWWPAGRKSVLRQDVEAQATVTAAATAQTEAKAQEAKAAEELAAKQKADAAKAEAEAKAKTEAEAKAAADAKAKAAAEAKAMAAETPEAKAAAEAKAKAAETPEAKAAADAKAKAAAEAKAMAAETPEAKAAAEAKAKAAEELAAKQKAEAEAKAAAIKYAGLRAVSCQTVTSTKNIPGASETLTVTLAYKSPGQTLTVTALADSDAPWMAGTPKWSGAVPVAGHPEQATVKITAAGETLVQAASGDAVKALKIVAVKEPPPVQTVAPPLQYRILADAPWAPMPDPMYVFRDIPVHFMAVKAFPDEPWPAGAPVWSGVEGEGDQAKQVFNAAETNFVTAACVNTVTGTVIVLDVQSIQPDPMANLQELDDGDNNPKTRVFVVPIAGPQESEAAPVVVKVTLVPESARAVIGAEKLVHTIARSAPSKSVCSFDIHGSDSGYRTAVYIYDARVGFFADNGGENRPDIGHSWGRYALDSHTMELIPPELRDYLDEISFWPAINGQVGCPGTVRLGPDAVGGTAQKEYPILFSALWSALPLVKASHDTPPRYDLKKYNCTDYAIWLGQIVDRPTMDPKGVSTPWDFSNWLNNN